MLKKAIALFSALLALHSLPAHAGQATLLNVSYDVTREFYNDYNPLFVKYWRSQSGETIAINQSHGGSSKQARAVIDGLDADVVTMNQQSDIDVLAEKSGLVDKNWRSRFLDNSSPYRSTIVFLVRKGNPKGIKDWDDLVRANVSPIIPNPKTSSYKGGFLLLGQQAR